MPTHRFLRTYLGHVNPGSTYWYLQAAPELLALAAKRLERAERAVRDEPARADAASVLHSHFEQLGTILHAAEAADTYRQEGLMSSGHAASERARGLARHCHGAATPTQSIAAALPLTAREREIATLAARGVSNR